MARLGRAFVADPGNHLIAADYSQIELRVLAHLSGDELLCTSFASGGPDHDPARWSTDSLLANGGVDCMLWLATLREQQLPTTSAPTIALFGPGMQPARPVDVAIPVGTPGLDHGGSIYRMDGVVSLPHGWGHNRPGIQLGVAQAHAGASINDLTDDQLTDRISGNAAFSAVPVEVRAA